jgi:small subunit ribosomal protein S12
MFNKKLSKPKLIVFRKLGFFKRNLYLARVLFSNPQKKATVSKVRITTPRKPNSARRKTVKSFYKFNKVALSYVPGGQHNLKQYSQVLLRGQGARDLPGIYTTTIRGKLDLKPVIEKTKRRSVYGVKRKKC